MHMCKARAWPKRSTQPGRRHSPPCPFRTGRWMWSHRRSCWTVGPGLDVFGQPQGLLTAE